jgi:hypothetical protein
MTQDAYDRVKAGKRMAGIFGIRSDMALALAIEEVLVLAECSHDGEWEGQVRYLPLR